MADAITQESTSIAAAALPKIAGGKGSLLWDTTGKRYLDGSGGPAVYCLQRHSRTPLLHPHTPSA